MKTLNFLLIYTLLALFVCSAYSQDKPAAKIDSAKLKDINKLLGLINTKDIGQAYLENIFKPYDEVMTNVNQKYWDSLKAGYKAEDLYIFLIPVYDKYFTATEVKELINIFESQAGKKFISLLANINNDSYEVCEKWATAVSNQIKERLTKDGIFTNAK